MLYVDIMARNAFRTICFMNADRSAQFQSRSEPVASDPSASPTASSAAEATDSATADRLLRQVRLNSLSLDSEDDLMSIVRQHTPQAVTGLWPEAALINHSCMPNSVLVAYRDR